MTWFDVCIWFMLVGGGLAIASYLDERRERRLAAIALERQRRIAGYLAGHREASRREIIQ